MSDAVEYLFSKGWTASNNPQAPWRNPSDTEDCTPSQALWIEIQSLHSALDSALAACWLALPIIERHQHCVDYAIGAQSHRDATEKALEGIRKVVGDGK